MKKTKLMSAAVAVLLALCLALPLGFTAFADNESYTITVTNAQENETYSAYKIFDVTTNESSGYSYTISKTSAFYNAVSAYAQTDGSGLTLTEAAVGGVYVVTIEDGFSAASFAAAMTKVINSVEANAAAKASEGQASVELDVTSSGAGYYLITCDSSAHALAELTTADKAVAVTDKNVGPTIDKQQKDNTNDEYSDKDLSVQIGDTVYYQITGKVPSTTGYESYTYEIKDTLSEGLTLSVDNSSNPNVIITVDDTQVYPANDSGESAWTVEAVKDADGNIIGFTAKVDMAMAGYEVGAGIVITYSAVVNENAVAGVYENKVELKYSNNPESGESTGTYEDKTEVYNATIAVYKTDNGEEPTPLADASFVLKNSEGKYYSYSDETVTWVDNINEATVLTTKEDGKFEKGFVGLKDGDYELIETKAPAGYNLLTNAVKVTISGAVSSDEEDSENNNETVEAVYVYTTAVQNSSGSELPETGGTGTQVLYIVGAALVVGAGVLLIVRFRMRKKSETD